MMNEGELVRKYLAVIGRRGGRKSRRKLTSEEAKRIVSIREARRKRNGH